MASRTSSRSGRSSRASASSSSNTTAFAIGGIGVAVVGLLVVIFANSGNDATAGGNQPANQPTVATPVVAPTPAPATVSEASRAGKAPTKAAPPLTAETLQQARTLLGEAKALCNEGVTARTAGNNQEARTKQSAAKDKLDALKALVAVPALWQEEAQLSDWAQPAEYVALEKLYAEVSKIEKQVRMGGGT